MRAVTAVRAALVVVGVAGIVWGAFLLVDSQRPDQWVGALIWLAAAVVAHDGVLMPLLALRRLARLRQQTAPADERTTGHGHPSPPAH